MKTLANPSDRQEVLQRMGKIRPDSPRQWGKMNAHQMICHLSDSFLAGMGEKFVSRATGPIPRGFTKWFALYVPVKWPHGVKTRLEMDPQRGGTRPERFDTDLKRVLEIMDRFALQSADFQWAQHPIFGRMTAAEWQRWGYLHTDHHLRQFGL